MNNYKIVAEFYRQFVEPRGFFNEQFSLIVELLELNHFPKDCRILDAGCGTGDVAVLLSKNKYTNIHAMDGSEFQLAQWPAEGDHIPRDCCRWENIGTYFKDNDPFDYIYILGHTLPHLNPSLLPDFFLNIYSSLKPGGAFSFDLRPWAYNSSGMLRQPGREAEVKNLLLPSADYNGGKFHLFDSICYTDNSQLVTYTLKPHDTEGNEIKETLEYFVYTWAEATEMLNDAGFDTKNVNTYKIQKWPYLVITAQKPE